MAPKGQKNTPEQEAKRSATAKAKNPTRYRSKEENKIGRPRGPHPDPVTPETRIRKGSICGFPRRGEASGATGVCCMPAGWGTDHVGTGSCRIHWGNTPANNQREAKTQAIQKAIIYGAPLNISPDVALLQEVHRTAGHVAWLQAQVAEFESTKDLHTLSAQGIRPSIIIEMYQTERQHLVKVCKVAIDSGIAERAVRIAESQAAMFAKVLLGFINDPLLELNPAQRIISKELMRKHLLSIDVTSVEVSAEPLKLPTDNPLWRGEKWEDMEVIDDRLH